MYPRYLDSFRAEFPVLAKLTYLNAGTDGPISRRCSTAMQRQIVKELRFGRSGSSYFAHLEQLWEALRQRLAGLMAAGAEEVALVRSTTDGINAVLWGLGLNQADEIVTSDQEHPGLLAPLAAVRRKLGVKISFAPLAEIAERVSARTRLVACSHVSWVSGEIAPVGDLATLDVPVLLDGAQALGAIPFDLNRLGCDFYAAPGQKWLCGPDSTGVLYVKGDWVERLALAWPHFGSLAEPDRPMALVPQRGARRFDSGFLPGPLAAGLLGALDNFESVGWPKVFEQAMRQAKRARLLLEENLDVRSRWDSTLISWYQPDASRVVEQLAANGVIVREIPGRSLIRASIGAWTSDDDLQRLLDLVVRLTR